MTSHLSPIVALAAGRTPGGELTFTFPEVLEAIKICTANQIAVLGVEIFRVEAEGSYRAAGSSDYDLRLSPKWSSLRPNDWAGFVRENNMLATETVSLNPVGDEHVYILTAASWPEFSELRPKTD